MNKIISKIRGFTLVELLIVIAIIAILSALIMANFAASRAKARDAKRISDIAQLQLALEQYFSKHNIYPITTDDFYGAALVPTYISALPKDPKTNLTTTYIYAPDPGHSFYSYILRVDLENPTKEGLTGDYLGQQCNPEGKVYCVGPN
jgi:prepilin-type N-terminal cleavage/methylation domain-containing protein